MASVQRSISSVEQLVNAFGENSTKESASRSHLPGLSNLLVTYLCVVGSKSMVRVEPQPMSSPATCGKGATKWTVKSVCHDCRRRSVQGGNNLGKVNSSLPECKKTGMCSLLAQQPSTLLLNTELFIVETKNILSSWSPLSQPKHLKNVSRLQDVMQKCWSASKKRSCYKPCSQVHSGPVENPSYFSTKKRR